MPNSMIPTRKNCSAKSVNTPSTSAPMMNLRTSNKRKSAPENSDSAVPMSENHCSGTIEKPVTRSKLSRIRRYNGYFDDPAWRGSCSTSISVGLAAKV